MPASHPPDVRRAQVPQGLFWVGIVLAPVAVLILLFGQSVGSLRVAVVLAVITIVLLAVSIAMRPSVEMLRVDIEHRVLDEVERVRVKAREDTTTAARNTHKALSDKIHVLTETVEDLRAQIDEVQTGTMLATHHAPPLDPAPAPAPGAPGTVRRTETVHVTRRTTTVNAGDQDGGGTVYGSRAAVDGEWRDRREDDGNRSNDRWDGMAQGSRWAEVRADENGRELHLGERRSSVHSDERGSEYRVEDRWAALRRDDPDDRSWLGRPEPRALPPARGASPDRYLDDRDEDRYRDSVRPRERDYDRDRGHDRDRGYDRDRERDYERDRGREPDRERDYGRERGHGRDRDYDRERGRDYDRERDYDRDRGYLPRPRSGDYDNSYRL